MDIHTGLDRGRILLGLDEDVCITGIEHKLADEFLCDWDSRFIGHTQVWKVIQKPEGKRKTRFSNSSFLFYTNKRICSYSNVMNKETQHQIKVAQCGQKHEVVKMLDIQVG